MSVSIYYFLSICNGEYPDKCRRNGMFITISLFFVKGAISLDNEQGILGYWGALYYRSDFYRVYRGDDC